MSRVSTLQGLLSVPEKDNQKQQQTNPNNANKQSQGEKEGSFKPVLVSKQINRPKDIDRLVYSKQQYEQALDEFRKSIEQNMQEVLFKPTTSRPQLRDIPQQENYRTKPPENLAKRLPREAKQPAVKKDKESTKKEPAVGALDARASRTSIVMLELKKQRRFEELFEQLSNQREELQSNDMNLAGISTATMQLLSPILVKIQENQMMKKEAFVQECQLLYAVNILYFYLHRK